MPTTRRHTPPRATEAAAVSVQFACAASGAPSARRLARWARAARPRGLSVVLRVVGAAEARRLNRRHRRRDYAPDVLAFDYRPAVPHGDVVLCHPVIARAARAQGRALAAQYAHMVVHALLHLAGHDHERGAHAARMRRAEARLLARLGFADPYRPCGRRA